MQVGYTGDLRMRLDEGYERIDQRLPVLQGNVFFLAIGSGRIVLILWPRRRLPQVT